MPPAIPVDQATGTIEAQAITFITPIAAKAGDTLLAIVATADGNDGPDLDDEAADGWEELASFTGSSSTVWLLRREAQPDDTGNISIPFLDALAWGLGALLVYRNLDTGAELVESSSTEITASQNFVCPARVLAAYSNLYLGIVLVTSAATAVAPPGGGPTEIHEEQSGGRTLAVYELLAEATGSTGTQTATTAAPQDGLAASAALAADPVKGYGLSMSFDPIGAIGLPSNGV